MDKRGLTLIELLIVIAIIGILAMIAVPAYIGQQKSAARTEAYSNLQNLRLLEEQFFAENSCYQPFVGGVCPVATTTFTGEAAIQAFLTGFHPGAGSFTYSITVANGKGLPNPVPAPYDASTVNLPNANTPCFITTATGKAGTRVAGDVFAIDCNNNRNF
jgi:prepilin-type N-terminal cleavage/methylation domain-containing protein